MWISLERGPTHMCMIVCTPRGANDLCKHLLLATHPECVVVLGVAKAGPPKSFHYLSYTISSNDEDVRFPPTLQNTFTARLIPRDWAQAPAIIQNLEKYSDERLVWSKCTPADALIHHLKIINSSPPPAIAILWVMSATSLGAFNFSGTPINIVWPDEHHLVSEITEIEYIGEEWYELTPEIYNGSSKDRGGLGEKEKATGQNSEKAANDPGATSVWFFSALLGASNTARTQSPRGILKERFPHHSCEAYHPGTLGIVAVLKNTQERIPPKGDGADTSTSSPTDLIQFPPPPKSFSLYYISMGYDISSPADDPKFCLGIVCIPDKVGGGAPRKKKTKIMPQQTQASKRVFRAILEYGDDSGPISYDIEPPLTEFDKTYKFFKCPFPSSGKSVHLLIYSAPENVPIQSQSLNITPINICQLGSHHRYPLIPIERGIVL
jgi:hypothetical protein